MAKLQDLIKQLETMTEQEKLKETEKTNEKSEKNEIVNEITM